MKRGKKHLAILVVGVCAVCGGPDEAQAFSSAVRKGVKTVVEWFAKKGGKEVGQELAEYGGRKAVQETVERVAREGGEESVERLVRLTKREGLRVMRVADSVPNPGRVLRAVDDLPAGMAGKALRRLASEGGDELAEMTARHGARILQAEVRHPGLAVSLVRNLGDDGLEMALSANARQATHLARHAGDVASLPAAQKRGVLNLLRRDFEKTVGFMGRFVEKNPGKVLFTAAGTSVFLANAEALLGDKGEIVKGPDGTPEYVPHPGLIERLLSPVIDKVLLFLLPLVAAGAAIWMALKLWHVHKVNQLKYVGQEHKREREIREMDGEARSQEEDTFEKEG